MKILLGRRVADVLGEEILGRRVADVLGEDTAGQKLRGY